MKKSIIILIAIVAVAVVAGVAFLLVNGNAPGNTGGTGGQGGLLPPVATGTAGGSISSTLSTAPTGSTFQIGTSQGSVTVNNIYKANDYITQDGQTIVIAQSDSYSIVYSVPDSGFIITLTSVPGSLQDARDVAEAVFLAKLGISKGDACKLAVQEGVIDKSSQYDGQLMSLSFCTGLGSASSTGAGPSSTGQ